MPIAPHGTESSPSTVEVSKASEASCNLVPFSLTPITPEQAPIERSGVLQTCYSCHGVKPREAFAKVVVKGKPYWMTRCNSCRAQRNLATPAFQRNRKNFEALKDKPCLDCGNRFPAECMDFDHVRGEDKKINVAAAWRWMTPEDLQVEVDKCDLVCSNCHRTRTKKRKQQRGRPARFLAESGDEAVKLYVWK